VKALPQHAFRIAVCIFVVLVIVLVYHHASAANATTGAMTFLVIVLIVSALWGFRYAAFLAVLSTLAFNYFFLPPLGTFTISDPRNWIALFAFLATAIIASELSERARREALTATQRRNEIERLYSFAQQLLTMENVPELLNALPRFIVGHFGARAAALFVAGREDIYRSGPDTNAIDSDQLKSVTARGESASNSMKGQTFVPLRLGLRSIGALGISFASMSRESLDALASLIAIAIERTRALENLSKTEASREGEKLRSAILDSITHEFRTPLTSIKASVTSMLSDSNLDSTQQQELLTVIDEETDRLNRLVGEAAEMARLDANQVELQLERRHIREPIERAVEEAKQNLGVHPVEIAVPNDLTATIDLERIKDVVLHLLDNAAKYSPPESPIKISADARNQSLTVSVSDRGPGIDDFEQGIIFDKFYRGKNERYRVQGTGMGLAIAKAVVEAHGGTIGVTSQLGSGSVFWFSLPRSA
jgi:two-component system sensor histidine kinase KdpD